MTINLEARKASLAILLTPEELVPIEKAFVNAGGDFDRAIAALRITLSQAARSKLERANDLCDWAGDDLDVLKNWKSKDLPTLAEIAGTLSDDELKALLPSTLSTEQLNDRFETLRGRLFFAEPTASIHRMAKAKALQLGDEKIEAAVAKFLDNLPDFDFRDSKLESSFDTNAFKERALKDIDDAVVPELKNSLLEIEGQIKKMVQVSTANGHEVEQPFDPAPRLEALGKLLTDDQKGILGEALKAANGIWEVARHALNEKRIDAATLAQFEQLNSLAVWTGDDAKFLSNVLKATGPTASLGDIALKFGIKELANLLTGTAEEKIAKARQYRQALFEAVPTQVVQRMLEKKELKIGNQTTEEGETFDGKDIVNSILDILKDNSGFDLRNDQDVSKLADGIGDLATSAIKKLALANISQIQGLAGFLPVAELLEPFIELGVSSAKDALAKGVSIIVDKIADPTTKELGENETSAIEAAAQRVAFLPSPQFNLLTKVLANPAERGVWESVGNLFAGDVEKTIQLIANKNLLPEPRVSKLKTTRELGEFTNQDERVVQALVADPRISSLDDIALKLSTTELAKVLRNWKPTKSVVEESATLAAATVAPSAVASSGSPTSSGNELPSGDDFDVNAIEVHRKLWPKRQLLQISNLIDNGKIKLSADIHDAVKSTVEKLHGIDTLSRSVDSLLQDKELFDHLDTSQAEAIKPEFANLLNNALMLSPDRETSQVLHSLKLNNARQIAHFPLDSFVSMGIKKAKEEGIKIDEASLISTHQNASYREAAVLTIAMHGLEATPGNQFALSNSDNIVARRLNVLNKITERANEGNPANKLRIDWEALFGTQDFCECGECNSVYSAAAYFVDILQFVRNNNEVSTVRTPGFVPPEIPYVHPSLVGTPLEKLLRRRPDIANLELSCSNTKVTIPYMDLANEVMESFIAYQSEFSTSSGSPKLSPIRDHDTAEDETDAELLAEPKHTNYKAYCELNKAVYPFCLPYHQPIDVQRIYLEYLKTTRGELLDKVRNPPPSYTKNWSIRKKEAFSKQAKIAMSNAVEAEFLGMTQEEYIILTRIAFKPLAFYRLVFNNKKLTSKEYRKKIGVLPVRSYYGYDKTEDLLNLDEFAPKGLTFVKDQFLPRTGMSYVDLVNLLKTGFVNRNQLVGRDLEIFYQIRSSYRFLMSLVDESASGNHKYDRVVQAISDPESNAEIAAALAAFPDLFSMFPKISKEEAASWVHRNFKRIGKLVVLADGPGLLFEGELEVGTIQDDGWLRDRNGVVIGELKIGGQVVHGATVFDRTLEIIDARGVSVAQIVGGQLLNADGSKKLGWLPNFESCDTKRVRLVHLDGTSLIVNEYGRIQRFVRLWRKLGWTMQEVDLALMIPRSNAHAHDPIGFEEYGDDCEMIDGKLVCKPRGSSPYEPIKPGDINPKLIRELASIKRLVNETSFSFEQIMSLWGNINTIGEKPLYERMFLTHDLRRMDPIFIPDAFGNVLRTKKKERLSKHAAAIRAALNIRNAKDLTNIITFLETNTKWKDRLTLDNISSIYRHWLLCKIFRVKTSQLRALQGVFPRVLESPIDTWNSLEKWKQIGSTGTSISQVDFAITGTSDPEDQIAPNLKTVLQLTQRLYDGLSEIQTNHTDIGDSDADLLASTNELVAAKLGLFFKDADPINTAIGILEGSTNYTRSAGIPPKLDVEIPSELKSKAKIVRTGKEKEIKAKLTITGLLSNKETATLKALSDNELWIKAIDFAALKAKRDYRVVFSSIFSQAKDLDEIGKILLAFDNNVDVTPENAESFDPKTSSKYVKRHAFLKLFVPVLRRFLSKKLIVETQASAVGLSPEIVETLISEYVQLDPTASTYDVLQQTLGQAVRDASGFNGYLVPPSDAEYRFLIPGDVEATSMPAPLLIDGVELPFGALGEGEFWTDSIPLRGGRVYTFLVQGIEVGKEQGLNWKSTQGKPSLVPANVLFPRYLLADPASQTPTQKILLLLSRAAIIIKAFNLSRDEIRFFAKSNTRNFDEQVDFAKIIFANFTRIYDYSRLRDQLRERESNLLRLFAETDATKTKAQVCNILSLTPELFDQLVKNLQIDTATGFRNETNLCRVAEVLDLARRTGASVGQLFQWTKLSVPFERYPKDSDQEFNIALRIADDIRKLVRSRFTQTEWEQVVKKLNDRLRIHMRDALIAYLLVQNDLRKEGVVDANSLFEYFLIDTQMEPEVLTSRMVQAVSTVQLFVQRCYLGLEEKYGIKAGDLKGRQRWEKWMKRYRVWEANRKVFLYPENWIQPSLRDDKSPFFKELESELLQKDVNPDTIHEAIKNYVFKLDEISDLACEGLFVEKIAAIGDRLADTIIHVFARTRNAPFAHFYTKYSTVNATWRAWEKVAVDIPAYDSDIEINNRSVVEVTGTYLTPVVWNNRLFLFFPQIVKKSAPNSEAQFEKPYQEIGKNNSPNQNKPIDYWEIKMAWSEYKNGRWTPKQVSTDAVVQKDLPKTLPKLLSFRFVPRLFSDKVVIDIDTNADQLWNALVRRKNVRLLRNNSSLTTETSPLLPNMNVSGNGIAADTNVQSIDQVTASLTLSKTPTVPPIVHRGRCIRHTIPRLVNVNCDSSYLDTELTFSLNSIHAKTPGFQFDGTHLFKTGNDSDLSSIPITTFQVDAFGSGNEPRLRSFQAIENDPPQYVVPNSDPSINLPCVKVAPQQEEIFFLSSTSSPQQHQIRHPFAHTLSGEASKEDINLIFSAIAPNADVDKDNAYGADSSVKFVESRRPFSLYNWELGFHIPMFLSERLLNAQQFDKALEMAHRVFDPQDGTAADPKSVWKFIPFKVADALNNLESILKDIAAGKPDLINQVRDWREHPFEPHKIARLRPTAYMKWTVMQYIRILIAYGDHFFRMNTLEFIPMAIQCYVMAAHLHGKPGEKIPKRGKKKVACYNDFVDKLDVFSNALVPFELLLPASSQIPVPIDPSVDDVALPNILGHLMTRYFCVPNNPMLTGLKETIDDRLFKIRHSLDINGVFRQLPLFEPPIDPALLVQATAQGLNLDSVLNDLNSPLPNYRFVYLHQKAVELCNELKSLGNAFLSTKEKRDSESLARLRAKHESTIQTLVLETKEVPTARSTESFGGSERKPKRTVSRECSITSN